MGQEYLATAVTGESEFLHNLGLLGLGHGSAIEVRALSVGVTLFLLKAALVVEPLIGEQFATVHTADGNDHTTLGGVSAIQRSSNLDPLDVGLCDFGTEDLSGHPLNGWHTDFEMTLFANPGDQFSGLFRNVCCRDCS